MGIFVQTDSPRWPTRKQVEEDRRERNRRREAMRQAMMATNEITNTLAVRMALMGYGVEEIHDQTGVDKYKLRSLVLGE